MIPHFSFLPGYGTNLTLDQRDAVRKRRSFVRTMNLRASYGPTIPSTFVSMAMRSSRRVRAS